MTWFKVDDNLAFHAKVVAAGNPAMGLWVRAGSWSAHTLTDGRIPAHMVAALGTTTQAAALVRAGLWVETDEGYAFHQWSADERQPTKESIETKRAAWREKKRNQRRGTSGQFVPEVSPEDSPGDKGESPQGSPTVPSRPVPSRPVPSRPVPSIEKEEQRAAAAPLRADVEGLLDLLDDRIQRNGAKTPARTKKNRDAARLLIDLDGHTVDEVTRAIHWATSDDFWRAHILSMAKLREKYDQLRLAAQRQRPTPGRSRVEENLDVVREIAARDGLLPAQIEGAH